MSARVADCPFCRIAAGADVAHLVWQDADCVAFLDHRPAARGHTLVTPKAHVETLWEADAETAAALMRTTREVAGLLRRCLGADGLTLRQNNGRVSGQEVPHLHVHLVPRWQGDGRAAWPNPPGEVDHAEVLRTLRT